MRSIMFLFLLFSLCYSHVYSETTGNKKPEYAKEVDELGLKIEENGKEIDRLGAQIDEQSNNMERSIEAHMGDVDSPVARQRIEEKGKDIDAISDYMDRLVERQGEDIEEQVTGTKHSVLENGTDIVKHVKETVMDKAIRLVEQQGNMVQTIGDSIDKDTSKRSHFPFLKWTKKLFPIDLKSLLRRDSIQLNPDDPNSYVKVPITRKKMDKLLMFYYIKRKYPKLVNHLLESESKDLKPVNTTHTVNLNESLSALESISSELSFSKLSSGDGIDTTGNGRGSINATVNEEVTMGIKNGNLEEDKVDSILKNLIEQEVNKEKDEQSKLETLNINLGDEDENKQPNTNLLKQINQTNKTSVNSSTYMSSDNHSANKDNSQLNTDSIDSIAKEVEKLQHSLDISTQLSSKSDTEVNSKQCTSDGEIGCMVKKLETLVHDYTEPNKKQQTLDSSEKAKQPQKTDFTIKDNQKTTNFLNSKESPKMDELTGVPNVLSDENLLELTKTKEMTGEARKGGGDPYASIGHNSFRHDHSHERVIANKFYDESIDSGMDSFHGGDISEWMARHWGHGMVDHPGQHEHGQSGYHDHKVFAHPGTENGGSHLHFDHHHIGPEHTGHGGHHFHPGHGHHYYHHQDSEGYGHHGLEHLHHHNAEHGHHHNHHNLEHVGSHAREGERSGGVPVGVMHEEHVGDVVEHDHHIDDVLHGHHFDTVTHSKDEKVSEEHDHMIHSMPDLHAVHFGDNIMNAIPHDFQKILQVEKEHEHQEKEAKEHEKMLKEALEGKRKGKHKHLHDPHGHLTDGDGFNHHQVGHLYGMHGYGFDMHTDHSEKEDSHHDGHTSQRELENEEEHDHFHHPGYTGSTEFIGDEIDFVKGRLHDNHKDMQENRYMFKHGTNGNTGSHWHYQYYRPHPGHRHRSGRHRYKTKDHNGKNQMHQNQKRCCNSTLNHKVDCKPCYLTGDRRDSDSDVKQEGGDDKSHKDKDIDTGDESDDQMYHEDHEHQDEDYGEFGSHHEGEPQFGEEHHKPEEHHPGELHNGAGQEGKKFHKKEENKNDDKLRKEEKEEQGHHHIIHNERNEHLHHHEFPIVHIDHDENVHQDPGETIHNQHEMITNQGTYVHVHEHPHQEVESDDRIVSPEVAHEGPISPLPAFPGETFHGPGIRDTPDVHFEDEMDTSRYPHRRSIKIEDEDDIVLSKRHDPYGSIGHYPEMHMDIHELGYGEIHSDHDGHFGCHDGGGYGWCPDGIGFGGHHHHHHNHGHHGHHYYDDIDDYDDGHYGDEHYHHEDEGSGEEEDHESEGENDRRHKVKEDKTNISQHKLGTSNTTNTRRVYHGIHQNNEHIGSQEKVLKNHQTSSIKDREATAINDDIDQEQYIQPPDSVPQLFNGHISLSIPHLRAQLSEEPSNHYQDNSHIGIDKTNQKSETRYAKDQEPSQKQPVEHQDSQNVINRVVHVTLHNDLNTGLGSSNALIKRFRKISVVAKRSHPTIPEQNIVNDPAKPLCRDKNGNIKLDVPGKREQLTNLRPCRPDLQNTKEENVVASLLYDDDIMPTRKVDARIAQQEKQWKEEEGRPFFTPEIAAGEIYEGRQGFLINTGYKLNPTSKVMAPSQEHNPSIEDYMGHIHNHQNINIHPALPYPNEQLKPDIAPVLVAHPKVVPLAKDPNVKIAKVIKVKDNIKLNAKQKQLTVKKLRPPIKAFSKYVSKHTNSSKTGKRRMLESAALNEVGYEPLCKDKEGAIQLDVNGKRFLTKPCRTDIKNTKEENVIATLLNDNDIMPTSKSDARILEQQKQWQRNEGQPFFTGEPEQHVNENHEHHDERERLNQGNGIVEPTDYMEHIHNHQNINIHPALPYPHEQLKPDIPIQMLCRGPHCAKVIRTPQTLAVNKATKNVKSVPVKNILVKNLPLKQKPRLASLSKHKTSKSSSAKRDFEDHHHVIHHHADYPYVGENGSDDFYLHDSHIHPPDMNVDRFNGHVHPAIPHFHEQIEDDHYDHHDHHKEHKDKKKEKADEKEHHYHEEQHPEPQYPQDHDQNRTVDVSPPHHWFIKPVMAKVDIGAKKEGLPKVVKKHKKKRRHGNSDLKRHSTRYYDDDDDDECEDDDDDDDCFDEGESDYVNHRIHIDEPDPNPHKFNAHIHPAIPHLFEQLEHEPYQPHYWIPKRLYSAFPPGYGQPYGEDHNNHGSHHDVYDGKPGLQHHHHHDDDRLVYISPHLHHHYETDHHHHRRHHHHHHENGDSDDDEGYESDESEGDEKRTMNMKIQQHDQNKSTAKREKRHIHHHRFNHHYRDHGNGDDDDDDEDEDGEEDAHRRTTGRDVAHLSYETEEMGRDMAHDIEEETHHVEDIGDAMESSINHGIARVQHLGQHIEAPDYDREGHFYPNVQDQDIAEEVEAIFPHASQHDLMDSVVEDHFHRQTEHFPMGRRIHYHNDDDDDDNEADED